MRFGDWDLLIEVIITAIGTAGVLAIAVGIPVSAYFAIRDRLGDPTAELHRAFRTRMAPWLLLGLELLIAADIIATVTLNMDLANVAALGLLVLIRTFLAWSIELENEGRWPWQRPESTKRT